MPLQLSQRSTFKMIFKGCQFERQSDLKVARC